MAEHADVGAYVLGLLEPHEETAFSVHLRTCDACRRELDELGSLPELLAIAAPPYTVPHGLEERTLAAIAPPRRRRRRWRWLRLGVPAAIATAAAALALFVLAGGDPPGERVVLASTRGEAVDVTAEVRVTPVGREVALRMRKLRDPRPDGLYELWFVAPGDRRGRPDRVSAGTFHPDASGRGEVRLLAAADPKRYPRLSVTLEPANGNPRRTGPEVLRARP